MESRTVNDVYTMFNTMVGELTRFRKELPDTCSPALTGILWSIHHNMEGLKVMYTEEVKRGRIICE